MKEILSVFSGEKNLPQMFEKLVNEELSLTSLFNTFKVDVREKEEEYVLDADLPGLKREQITLGYENNRLTITVKDEELTVEDSEADAVEKYLHRERKFTKMTRSFFVTNIDQTKIRAKYENGVLTVTLPKVVAPSGSSINID